MKQKDVVIGMVVNTRIGEERCNVIVMSVVPGNPDSRWSDEKRTSFRVRRVGADKDLPKRRSAAALEQNTK